MNTASGLLKKRKILLCSSDRSERGLLEPIAKKLNAYPAIDFKWFPFEADENISNVIEAFEMVLNDFQPDIVVVPCDRWEMVYVAAYAFHQNRVVAHFHAGNNPTDHPDDMNRRVISCFSHIMFCNAEEHRQNLIRLGEEPWRIYTVGSTILDDVEVDDSQSPRENFDLVVLHPDPLSRDNTVNDLNQTVSLVAESPKVVWIYPNHDKNYEVIKNFLDSNTPNWLKYVNLPRSQFLGMMKKCSRAIGNSSAFFYELPIVNARTEVIRVGHRNQNLAPLTSIKTGASQRIVDLLATLIIDEKLLRKRLTCR